MSKFRLRVVYDDAKVYVEYDPQQFKSALIQEFIVLKDLEEAFDSVCKKLKQEMSRM